MILKIIIFTQNYYTYTEVCSNVAATLQHCLFQKYCYNVDMHYFNNVAITFLKIVKIGY